MFLRMQEAWNNRRNSKNSESDAPATSKTASMPAGVSAESFPISVISLEGDVFEIGVKPDFTVEKVKTIAVKHFYSHDTSKMSTHYHLVHSLKYRHLLDENNLIEEEIEQHDELLLLKVSHGVAEKEVPHKVLMGPTKEAIMEVTRDLPVRNLPQAIPSMECTYDNFQNELQKILVTLVKASARILMYSSDASKYYDVLEEKLKAKCKPTIDPNAVKTLMAMGYSQQQVLKALRLRKSNMSEALEWLIENQIDSDEDDDLDFLNNEGSSDTEAENSSLPINLQHKSLRKACVDLFKEEAQSSKTDMNLIDIVDLLVDSYQRYKKVDFKPNSRALQSFIEMGFEEKDIVGALKITGNNPINACEWLLGERRPSLEDLGEGLNPDGLMYKGIMNNPHIQFSLTNPKMLLVYLSMLETPGSVSVWHHDSDVLPILNQILKTYQDQKHAIHLNRHMSRSY